MIHQSISKRNKTVNNQCMVPTITRNKLRTKKTQGGNWRTHLQLAINLGGRIRHGVAVRVEAQRREERHEERVRQLRIRNPNGFSAAAAAVVEERAHHPVLHAVLFLQARVFRPRRPVLGGDRSLRRAPAVNHADVEAAREIVHVDPERRVGSARTGLNHGQRFWEEIGSNVEGAYENWVWEEENEHENKREKHFSIHGWFSFF